MDDEQEPPNMHNTAALDQSVAALSDLIPRTAHGIYTNSISQGFSEDQALRIATAYVHGFAGGKLQ